MEVPYLSRLFEDAEEQLEPLEGVLTQGQIPSWLVGCFYRTGPGKFSLGDEFSVNHWFDGMAIVCKFSLNEDGSATLLKRFVESEAYSKGLQNQKTIFTEFGTRGHPDPSRWFLSRYLSSILPTDMTDNSFHNVYVINNHMFSAGETSLIHQLDPDTLQTGTRVDLHKELGVNLCSSHPVQDADGFVYTLGVSFNSGFKYQINKIPPNLKAGNLKEVFSRNGSLATIRPPSWTSYSYYHTFGVTDNYIVFMEVPLFLVLPKLMSMVVKGKSLRDCIEWQPEKNVRIHVLLKSDGSHLQHKFTTDEPFFQAHMANAYEDAGHVVLDLITYAGPSIFDTFCLDKLRASRVETSQSSRVTRLVIPVHQDMDSFPAGSNLVTLADCRATARLEDGLVVMTPDHFEGASNIDYPTINPTRHGRPHRYLFVSSVFDQGAMRGAVGRLDMRQRQWKRWQAGQHCHPSEAVFVPRPTEFSDGELDGALMLTVTDAAGSGDFLAVIDPQTMVQLARIQFSTGIPFLIHGLWLFQNELDLVKSTN